MSNKTIEKKVKVSELIKILRANENFLRSISYENRDSILLIREFRTLLKPYGNLDAKKFLEILTRLLKDKRRIRVSALLSKTDIERVSLDEVEELVSSENLEAKDLLFIAEKHLEIPTGVLKKMRKELIRQKILATIHNIKKLDAIQKKASE